MKSFNEFVNESKDDKINNLIEKVKKKSTTGWKKVLSVLTENQINFLCSVIKRKITSAATEEKHNGMFSVNKDNTITVYGHVDINATDIYGIYRIPVKFHTVYGNFSLYNSKITSLEGCPEIVDHSFYLINCQDIKSLEGGPSKINGSSYSIKECHSLKNLEGCARELNTLDVFNNKNIESLKGAPSKLWNLKCVSLPKLKNLEGLYSPNPTSYHLEVSNCPNFNSLKGITDNVYSLNLNNNSKLVELDFCPEIKYELDLRQCENLKSLKNLKAFSLKSRDIEIKGCKSLLSKEKTVLENSELFEKWSESKMTMEEFTEKYKALVSVKRFGL